jgi:hypothetical protein
MKDMIPLPEHLKTCGCPRADSGTHLTSCEPARAYDETPLSDRPEYEEGRSFACVRWEFPLRLTATVSIEVNIDPYLWIKRFQKEYDEYELEPGFDEWEKPMCYLASLMAEEPEMTFGYPRHVSSVWTDLTDVGEYPRWTQEMTDDLHARLYSGAQVSEELPGQETLFQPNETETD